MRTYKYLFRRIGIIGKAAGAADEEAGEAAREGQAGKVLRALLTILVACTLMISCAEQPKAVRYKKVPTRKPPAEAPAPAAPKPPEAVRTNARPSTADVVTPQRQASLKLVEKGNRLLDAQNFELAAAAFRDAINIDATNGIAYYHLADANAKLGHQDAAMGLLDKAEALLGADAQWMERIDGLRTELGAPPSQDRILQSPIDAEF